MEPTASERFWSTAADGPQQTAEKQSALWQCTDPCGGILECYWHLHTPLKSQVICGVKRGFSPDTIPSWERRAGMQRFLLFSNKEELLFVASWSNELLSVSCLWNSSSTSFFCKAQPKVSVVPLEEHYIKGTSDASSEPDRSVSLSAVLFTSCFWGQFGCSSRSAVVWGKEWLPFKEMLLLPFLLVLVRSACVCSVFSLQYWFFFPS